MDSTLEQLRFASIPGCSIRADFAGGSLSSDLEPLLRGGWLALLFVVVGMMLSGVSSAIEDRANVEPNDPVKAERRIAWKLTPSVYHETAGRSAVDLNLRGNVVDDVFWIGQYRRGSEFQQLRGGYEHQFSLPFGKLIASAQAASRGFLGGSATFEIGEVSVTPFYALIGFGRTNLKPYYNLNFDPNDSTLIGGGWRSADQANTATLYRIHDDRLGTGQTVTHLVLRSKTGERSRLTVDLFRREGRSTPDAEYFVATGVSVTYDKDPWFIRLAIDPRASFTASDMTRLAVGMRF